MHDSHTTIGKLPGPVSIQGEMVRHSGRDTVHLTIDREKFASTRDAVAAATRVYLQMTGER